jgi:hypothetical protein
MMRTEPEQRLELVRLSLRRQESEIERLPHDPDWNQSIDSSGCSSDNIFNFIYL